MSRFIRNLALRSLRSSTRIRPRMNPLFAGYQLPGEIEAEIVGNSVDAAGTPGSARSAQFIPASRQAVYQSDTVVFDSLFETPPSEIPEPEPGVHSSVAADARPKHQSAAHAPESRTSERTLVHEPLSTAHERAREYTEIAPEIEAPPPKITQEAARQAVAAEATERGHALFSELSEPNAPSSVAAHQTIPKSRALLPSLPVDQSAAPMIPTARVPQATRLHTASEDVAPFAVRTASGQAGPEFAGPISGVARPSLSNQKQQLEARSAASPSPDVYVTIGRVEVRATVSGLNPEKRPTGTRPLPLAEYLNRRDGSGGA